MDGHGWSCRSLDDLSVGEVVEEVRSEGNVDEDLNCLCLKDIEISHNRSRRRRRREPTKTNDDTEQHDMTSIRGALIVEDGV